MSTYNMIAAGYTQVTGYANAAALNAADSDSHYNGYKVAVADIGVFYLNKESVATPDNATVIAALGGGNWLLWTSPYVLVNTSNMIDASQYGAVDALGNGSAGAPSLAFESSTTTGIYRVAADDFGIATAGVLRFDISTTAVTSTLPVIHPAGTAAAPSITFASDTNFGLYRVSADVLGIACSGVLAVSVGATALTCATGMQVVLPASTAAAPAIVIGGEQTGPYLISAGNLGFAIAGVLKATLSATVLTLVSGIQLNVAAGSAAAPSITVGGEQTGPYLVGAGSYGISIAGTIKLNLTATALNMASGVALQIATVQVVGARNTGWTTFAGTGTKNQSAINVDTFTATDANIRLLGQGVKGILDALILHGLLGA